MPILLEDDQFVGRLNYYDMSETPTKVYGGSIGSSYQQQGLALSKQFKREHQNVSSVAAGAPSASAYNREAAPAANTDGSKRGEDGGDEDSILKIAFPDSGRGLRLNAKNC
jgi:hypothetical protein